MAKAKMRLRNGTAVVVEGSVDEINALLSFYGAIQTSDTGTLSDKASLISAESQVAKRFRAAKPVDSSAPVNDGSLSEIVNVIKTCDEAEAIERNILDRTSQVDRTLLPLYVVHEYLGNQFDLSSGEISKVTSDLGVPVSQPNVSRALSGNGSRYVIGDRVRVKGMQVRYKLSRRGLQYMKTVITGSHVGASESP